MCSHFLNGKGGNSWYRALVDSYCTKLYDLQKKKVKRKAGQLCDTPPIQKFTVRR